MDDKSDPKCPRCGTELKTVIVLVPVEGLVLPLGSFIPPYETRDEIADCPRCTGGY